MTGIAVKERLRAGDTISVCNTDFPTPQLVEFVGQIGFDALFIDCEASSTDFKLVEELSRAARVANMPSIVRPWTNDPGLINRYLSCGAGGVQVPRVQTMAEAEAVLEGLRRWEGNYEEKLLVMMIESQEGLDNLPALLKLPQVDVFYFGPFDLAESMGLKGNPKHPKVKAAVEDGIKRVADAGKVPGMNVQDEIEAVTRYMDLGLRWINVHLKTFMERGSKAFLQVLKERAS